MMNETSQDPWSAVYAYSTSGDQIAFQNRRRLGNMASIVRLEETFALSMRDQGELQELIISADHAGSPARMLAKYERSQEPMMHGMPNFIEWQESQ